MVFEVDNNRQTSVVIERAIFRYPIPAQVHLIIAVDFPGASPTSADSRSWRIEAGQVVVEFLRSLPAIAGPSLALGWGWD
ncbi:hypothetical protein [Aquihabitans sp. McL0605]|uniref:hypothetical protein n=1 Tax=Aquihabitans sp. McL0605 TaxID=3415671 RepID=UPI003CF157B8